MTTGTKSTELKVVAATLLIGLLAQCYVTVIAYWAVGVTIATTGYLMSRAFFKHSRGNFQHRSYRTTEMYVFVSGLILILESIIVSKLDIGIAYLLVCIQSALFCISRGYTKNMNINNTQVHLLR